MFMNSRNLQVSYYNYVRFCAKGAKGVNVAVRFAHEILFVESTRKGGQRDPRSEAPSNLAVWEC